MTPNPLQAVLLLLSCASLAGLALSAVLVSRAQQTSRRLQERFAMITAPHARPRRIEVSAFVPQAPAQQLTLIARLGAVLRINPEKLDTYPMQWWLVMVIALAIANVARILCADLLGVLADLGMPVVWAMLCRAFFGWADKRQRDKMLNQFPDALSMIVRSVRVGIPVMEAIRAVAREAPAPTGEEFERLVNQVSVGGTLEDAVLQLAQRSGLPEYRFFATALALQNQTGGTLSEALENLAEVIRKRVALKEKGYAMTAEARTSALVLGAIPVLTGAAMWAMNPNYIGILFNDPTGHKLLAASVLSLTTGMFIIRAIIRRTLP